MTAGLRCEVKDRVATVTLDNPAKRNALTVEMLVGLSELLHELRDDRDVRVLVLTGEGEHFCAGADINALEAINAVGDDNQAAKGEAELAGFPKPTIALIRGFCIGGGAQFAAACDLRLADTTAQFGVTPSKIGVVYPHTSVDRLVRLIGPAATKHLLYTGDLIDADRALRIGLVDELLDPTALDDRVAELAATMVSRSQLTQVAAKHFIGGLAGGSLTAEEALRWQQESWRGEVAEGKAAFLERRTPKFTWPD